MKYFTSHSPHLNEYVLMDWLTEAAARAHGVLTTTNLNSCGYLSAVTFNITKHNHWITTVLQLWYSSKALWVTHKLFSQVKSKWLDYFRMYLLKYKETKQQQQRKNCMFFNGKNIFKVHVWYDSRPVSSSSSSYISQPLLCFIFISTVPSSGLVCLVVVNSGQKYKSKHKCLLCIN